MPEREALNRHVGIGRGRPALDIGSGDGALVQALAELGYRPTGIDCAPSALSAARHEHSGLDFRHFDFDTDDLADLPEPAFALITCRLVHRRVQDKHAFYTPWAGPDGVAHDRPVQAATSGLSCPAVPSAAIEKDVPPHVFTTQEEGDRGYSEGRRYRPLTDAERSLLAARVPLVAEGRALVVGCDTGCVSRDSVPPPSHTWRVALHQGRASGACRAATSHRVPFPAPTCGGRHVR